MVLSRFILISVINEAYMGPLSELVKSQTYISSSSQERYLKHT